jgi:hypothetical protein
MGRVSTYTHIRTHTHIWTQGSGPCWPSKPPFLAGNYTNKLSLHFVANELRQLLTTIADIELTTPGTALPSTTDTALTRHNILQQQSQTPTTAFKHVVALFSSRSTAASSAAARYPYDGYYISLHSVGGKWHARHSWKPEEKEGG